MRGAIVRKPLGFALGLAIFIGAGGAAVTASAAPSHGLSLFGDLKYGPEFKHFDYANPSAPKGGTMRLSAIGTFDTLNPYIVKGVPAAGMGQTFDTLMLPSRGRARQRIRPRRRKRRSGAGPQIGAVHAAQGGPFPRRLADHAGGRDLDLRHAAREGPADVPLLLRRRGARSSARASAASGSISNRPTTANCRRSSGRCRSCRKNTGRAATSRKRRSTRRSAAAPTRSSRSIPGARSPISRVPDYWARRSAGQQGAR